jgi:predicted ATPase
MIQHVSFRNFKALRHVEVPLERLTVIVGPNSSGKTSILQGMDFLCDIASKVKHHTTAEKEFTQFQLYSKGATGDLEVIASLQEGMVRARMNCQQSPEQLVQAVHSPVVSTEGWDIFVEGCQGGESDVWRPLKGCPGISAALPRSALVRFDASRLSQPSPIVEAVPTLGNDGTGLPSVLASMDGTYPDEFSRLQCDLRKVIPTVARIRFERVKVQRREIDFSRASPKVIQRVEVGDAVLFDMTGAKWVPASQVSEGTILVLALFTVLHRPPQPDLVLIDDLGHGLHPKAQRDLVAVLREIMERRPNLQIVATTHSPYLLDKIEPQEVRLTTLKDDGSVACASMTEHPDFERWKAEFNPGEFWSVIGEKWVGKREPVEAAAP